MDLLEICEILLYDNETDLTRETRMNKGFAGRKSVYIEAVSRYVVASCAVLWQFVPFCGSLCRFVAVCAVLWQLVPLCGSLWQFVPLCGSLWQFVPLCGDSAVDALHQTFSVVYIKTPC